MKTPCRNPTSPLQETLPLKLHPGLATPWPDAAGPPGGAQLLATFAYSVVPPGQGSKSIFLPGYRRLASLAIRISPNFFKPDGNFPNLKLIGLVGGGMFAHRRDNRCSLLSPLDSC